MNKEHSKLSELICKLRGRTDLTQSDLAQGTHIDRHAVGRYERGATRPPVGYVAFLARLVWEREAEAKRPALGAKLLEELNDAIIAYYGRGSAIKSWPELCALADRWLDEGKQERQQQLEAAEAPVVAAEIPVAERPAAPWQLRAATPDFVGREVELVRLVAALRGDAAPGRRAALACIRGLGGVGKSELAYRVAEELAGDFPDGQLLLELAGSGTAPMRPEEALAQLVRGFTPQAHIPQGLADLRALYRTTLRDRRVLILADDARDTAQLRELLAPPGSALLITTRWRFALDGLSDAGVVELGGLAADEAAQLLLSLCPRIGAAAHELAVLCGFLPLALRIAGGRLASDATLRVTHYLLQLRDERTRLAALEGEDAERSVAAVLQLSYAALEPPAQAMLAQLSVFPASFHRDALSGVVMLADEDSAGALDRALSQLHRASLVEVDAAGERVWLHDLVRALAASQLEDREGVQRRHAATYGFVIRHLSVAAREGGPEALSQTLAFYDADRANVEEGIRWVLTHAVEPESAQILVDYVLGVPAVGLLRLHPTEVLFPLYTAGLELGRRRQELPLELVALNNLGVLASHLGNEAQAQSLYEQALALLKATPEGESTLLTLHLNLAKSLSGQGELDRARIAAEAFRQTSIAARDVECHIRSLILLGVIERRSDRPERAVQYGEEALALARRSGHKHLERLVLGNLANAIAALPITPATSAELYARATGYAIEALAIATQLKDTFGQAEALSVLGNVATLHGDPREAVQRQQEALAVAQAADHDHLAATVLINLGDSYRALREGELAAAAYEQGVRAFEGLSDAYGLARALWRYGQLVVRLHEFAGTKPTVDEAQRAALLWERAVELERGHNLPTAHEHAETLQQLQRWLATHQGSGSSGPRKQR